MAVTGQASQNRQSARTSAPPCLGPRARARADAAESQGGRPPAMPPQAQEAGEEVALRLGRLLGLKGPPAARLACVTRDGARCSVWMGPPSLSDAGAGRPRGWRSGRAGGRQRGGRARLALSGSPGAGPKAAPALTTPRLPPWPPKRPTRGGGGRPTPP